MTPARPWLGRGITTAAIAALAACGSTSPRATPPTTVAVEPVFASNSFWTRPLGPQPPSDPTLARLTAAMRAQLARGVYIDTTSYSEPVYVVGAHQPTVPVHLWLCDGRTRVDPQLESMLSAVPIPASAAGAPGTDSALIVWQPSSDTDWELWKARRVDGQWQACWGGRLQHLSQSNGVFPYPYGVSASGLTLLGGLIRISEAKRYEIDHVLEVSVPYTARGHVPPATRSDGSSSNPIAVPEGSRFRLDPKVDVAALHLDPFAAAVATALQRYGMIVEDTNAGVVSFGGEQPTGAVNPWPAIFSELPGWKVLSGIPWNRIEAVPPSAP